MASCWTAGGGVAAYVYGRAWAGLRGRRGAAGWRASRRAEVEARGRAVAARSAKRRERRTRHGGGGAAADVDDGRATPTASTTVQERCRPPSPTSKTRSRGTSATGPPAAAAYHTCYSRCQRVDGQPLHHHSCLTTPLPSPKDGPPLPLPASPPTHVFTSRHRTRRRSKARRVTSPPASRAAEPQTRGPRARAPHTAPLSSNTHRPPHPTQSGLGREREGRLGLVAGVSARATHSPRVVSSRSGMVGGGGLPRAQVR